MPPPPLWLTAVVVVCIHRRRPSSSSSSSFSFSSFSMPASAFAWTAIAAIEMASPHAPVHLSIFFPRIFPVLGEIEQSFQKRISTGMSRPSD